MSLDVLKRNWQVLCVLGIVLLLTSAVALYMYMQSEDSRLDTAIKKVFSAIPDVHSYTQYVDTQVQFPSRVLSISGTYDVDTSHQSFAGYSTTTLAIDGDSKKHVFTHKNIAIENDVFTKIETSDALLKNSIKSNPQWQHYKKGSIPDSLTSVAIVGPIQDNLQLLSHDGQYLTLTKKFGTVHWGADALLRYTFKISDQGRDEKGGVGALGAMIDRIGKDGTVDVWANPANFTVRHLLFKSSGYISTTTISNINTLPVIQAPIDSAPR